MRDQAALAAALAGHPELDEQDEGSYVWREPEEVEAIGRLIARSPEGLAALGVKGFEEGELEDLEAEGEDDGWWR